MARQPEGSPVLDGAARAVPVRRLDTCAADGSCRLRARSGIDTGELVKRCGAAEHSASPGRARGGRARRWSTVESSARAGLRAGRGRRRRPPAGLTGLGRGVLGRTCPGLGERMPDRHRRPPRGDGAQDAAAVYFPACMNRIFGNPRGATRIALAGGGDARRLRSRRAAAVDPARRRRALLRDPVELEGLPRRARRVMARAMAEAALGWTARGRLPLLTDASSCAQTLAGGELARGPR